MVAMVVVQNLKVIIINFNTRFERVYNGMSVIAKIMMLNEFGFR